MEPLAKPVGSADWELAALGLGEVEQGVTRGFKGVGLMSDRSVDLVAAQVSLNTTRMIKAAAARGLR